MEELLKKLKELDSSLAEEVQKEITKRNEEAKKQRIKKVETDKLLKELLTKIGTEKPEEAITKVETNNNEVKALSEKLRKFEEQFNAQAKAAEKLEIENKIISKLNDFKVKKNFDFMKESLTSLAVKGESGELLVGDKTLDDYLQKLVDEDETITEGKAKKNTKNGNSELYSEEE